MNLGSTMFDRLRNNFLQSNYGLLAAEFVVVILSILIAFQIERWGEERRGREQELEYLQRLKVDLQIEMQSMEEALQFAQSRIDNVLLLESAIADATVVRERPEDVTEAVEKATWRSFPQINAFVYSELQSTGHLGLMRSDALRRNLANHYSSLRHHERVGMDLTIQQEFDRLTAGLLKTEELRDIERGSWEGTSVEVSAERAAEIVEELANRPGALALLPNISQHHVFNQKVIELARDRTNTLIEVIDQLLAADGQ